MMNEKLLLNRTFWNRFWYGDERVRAKLKGIELLKAGRILSLK
jgi:hypothetical protein